MDLKVFTYADIMEYGPCFDPASRGYCGIDWSGTVLDVLKSAAVTNEHKAWLVCQDSSLIPNSVSRIFIERMCQMSGNMDALNHMLARRGDICDNLWESIADYAWSQSTPFERGLDLPLELLTSLLEWWVKAS